MKTIYLDCSNGVSGDMVLNALIDLTDDPASIQERIKLMLSTIDDMTVEAHSHHADNSHFHRSYNRVIEIIEGLGLTNTAEAIAKNIYRVIAVAESKVHGSPMDDLHFHEVGRNRAIANIAGVALCIDTIEADMIVYDVVCDGSGTVECAHGTLSVPVPAVKAMLDEYDINYHQTDHDGEMVTPSGLAMIIGIGSERAGMPKTDPVMTSEAKGARSTDGNGLKAFLFEG